jgi:hypothetical protein
MAHQDLATFRVIMSFIVKNSWFFLLRKLALGFRQKDCDLPASRDRRLIPTAIAGLRSAHSNQHLAAVSLVVRKFLSLIASSFGVACLRETNYATPNLFPRKM